MNKSDNMSSPFEKQLQQSAVRLRDEQNYQLPLRKSPHRHRPVITWAASIAAACIGWIVGISFPLEQELPRPDLALNIQPDTVIQYQKTLVHDTIIKKVEIPVKVEVASTPKPAPEADGVLQGCNVECDGIDYALLVGM